MLDPAPTSIKPPRKLGDVGSCLWERLQNEYRIDDAAGIELLLQVCAASDRIERLSEMIDRDGEIIETKNGPRPNPLLREELSLRRFVCKTLQMLGLNLEPTRAGPGRPSAWVKRREDRDAEA